MCSINICTKPHVFTSFTRLKKISIILNYFFQSLVNDDVKVNKTRKKLDLELDSLFEF